LTAVTPKICFRNSSQRSLCAPNALVFLGGAGVKNCDVHGTDYIEFKCKFCCSVALWFCHGNTHYCDPCHKVAGKAHPKDCPGNNKAEKCPLKIDHPASGEEFALGCGLCRSSLINVKDF
jgi:hypothetical protein